MNMHGGKRAGAGRPKAKAKRVKITPTVHPDTPAKLRKHAKSHGSIGRAIDFLAGQNPTK
jgi:hypothetical protein